MSKTGFVWRALAALILVILLIGGGVAVYYAGWAQGYGVSQPAVESGESEMPPYLYRGYGHYGRPMAFMFGAGMVFKCLVGFIFFIVICKLIRFIFWGAFAGPMMAGPWFRWHHAYRHRGPHGRRRYRRYGPVPPWCWDWDESDEGEAEADSDQAEV